jgi:hypothetical protein
VLVGGVQQYLRPARGNRDAPDTSGSASIRSSRHGVRRDRKSRPVGSAPLIYQEGSLLGSTMLYAYLSRNEPSPSPAVT